MTQKTKISKSNPIALDLAKRTVTVQVFGARTTKKKDGTPAANPKIVFGLAGAKDVQQAAKAGYPVVQVYGMATDFDEGDLLEVTIRPLPKSAS
jgi:hypothetical protein